MGFSLKIGILPLSEELLRYGMKSLKGIFRRAIT
jgi:hypothetical protein